MTTRLTSTTDLVPHEDLRLDGILRLIEEAGQPGPLTEVLTTLARRIAVVAHADVVSIYVMDAGWLVMRANVGFNVDETANVRLQRGQGIVGATAEAMRPISASVAKEDPHYQHVPDLGEERYPSFLSIPLIRAGDVAGVLVLQRSEAIAFTDAEVALATALATTITHALERGGTAADGAPRSARLTAQVSTAGAALGRAVLLGSLESLEGPAEAGVSDPGAQVAQAFEAIAAVLAKGQRRALKLLPESEHHRLMALTAMVDDQRLRGIMTARCAELGVVAGLRQVAREYAGASYATGETNPVLAERAAEIEQLCLLVAGVACDMPYAAQGTCLVVPEQLTVTLSLAVLGFRTEAVVVAGSPDPQGLGLSILRAADVPALCDVAGLFAWVRQGDTLIVDAGEHVLRVNPPATLIARYRRS